MSNYPKMKQCVFIGLLISISLIVLSAIIGVGVMAHLAIGDVRQIVWYMVMGGLILGTTCLLVIVLDEITWRHRINRAIRYEQKQIRQNTKKDSEPT